MLQEVTIELSRLIDLLNTRFGTDFKLSDQLFFDSVREDAVADPALRQAAMVNTKENFGFVFLKTLGGIFIDRMENNENITARYLNDREFKTAIGEVLLHEVYDKIRQAAA